MAIWLEREAPLNLLTVAVYAMHYIHTTPIHDQNILN